MKSAKYRESANSKLTKNRKRSKLRRSCSSRRKRRPGSEPSFSLWRNERPRARQWVAQGIWLVILRLAYSLSSLVYLNAWKRTLLVPQQAWTSLKTKSWSLIWALSLRRVRSRISRLASHLRRSAILCSTTGCRRSKRETKASKSWSQPRIGNDLKQGIWCLLKKFKKRDNLLWVAGKSTTLALNSTTIRRWWTEFWALMRH